MLNLYGNNTETNTQSVTSFTDCNVTCAKLFLCCLDHQNTAQPYQNLMKMQLKLLIKVSSGHNGLFPRGMYRLLLKAKMTTDYYFAIDLTGKNCQLMNLRKEIN